MIDLLGLPSFIARGITETADGIVINVSPSQPFTCPRHPEATMHSGGKPVQIVFQDLPMRGKPVRLRLEFQPLDCSVCKLAAYRRSPDLDPHKAMTRRLIRFVEDALLRETVTVICRLTGLTQRQVAPIATRLADKLEAVKFTTPDIIAMDGIHVTRETKFQVVTDGRTGLPIAVFRGLSSDIALKLLPNLIDMNAVRVLVTDMDSAYKTVRRHMPNAKHVADKFHVIEKVNSAVYAIVGDVCADLRARGLIKQERALRLLRPALAGRRTPAQKKDGEFALDPEVLPQKVSRHESIAAAHRARWQMLHFYRSSDCKEASLRLNEFLHRATDEKIQERMAETVTYVTNGRPRILAYFDSIEIRENGALWGPTTTSAERRNSNLRDLWRQARGYRDDRQFWLKAVFHPYRLDAHLVECGKCGRIEGPLPVFDNLAVARLTGPVVLPQDRRCEACRIAETPPRVETRDGALDQAA